MANWCGKCRQIAPEVDKLIDQYPNVVSRGVVSLADLAPFSKEMGIEAMPTFKFYKEGREVNEVIARYKPKLLRTAVEAFASKRVNLTNYHLVQCARVQSAVRL